MKPEEQIMTFDRAMNLSRHEATELFRRHINHPLASLLKLGNVDMRFTKAEGIYLYDEEGQRYMDLTAGQGTLKGEAGARVVFRKDGHREYAAPLNHLAQKSETEFFRFLTSI
jgi:4-aminobutyrate aminotransferase-like enzyme